MGEAVVAGDIPEVWRRAMQGSYTNFRYEKANLSHKRNPDKHSLEAIDILEEATNMDDRYLINKLNKLYVNADFPSCFSIWITEFSHQQDYFC